MFQPLLLRHWNRTIVQVLITATDHPDFWSGKWLLFPSYKLLSIKLDFFPSNKKFYLFEASSFRQFWYVIFICREAADEIAKLSQLAGQLNPKLQEVTSISTNGGSTTNPSSTIDNGGVDLDQLFNFLSGEIPDSIRSESVRSEFSSVRSSTGDSSNEKEASILDEIDR